MDRLMRVIFSIRVQAGRKRRLVQAALEKLERYLLKSHEGEGKLAATHVKQDLKIKVDAFKKVRASASSPLPASGSCPIAHVQENSSVACLCFLAHAYTCLSFITYLYLY